MLELQQLLFEDVQEPALGALYAVGGAYQNLCKRFRALPVHVKVPLGVVRTIDRRLRATLKKILNSFVVAIS